MREWQKKEIVLSDGSVVSAQTPVIVSVSRSTDIPAFYSNWFIERLEAGYVKWINPFNGVPLYVSFDESRLFVFWSKNPAPILEKLPGHDVADFNLLCSLNVFNGSLMNDEVYKFKRYEDSSLVYTGLESRHEGEAVGLFNVVLTADEYGELYRQQQAAMR